MAVKTSLITGFLIEELNEDGRARINSYYLGDAANITSEMKNSHHFVVTSKPMYKIVDNGYTSYSLVINTKDEELSNRRSALAKLTEEDKKTLGLKD